MIDDTLSKRRRQQQVADEQKKCSLIYTTTTTNSCNKRHWYLTTMISTSVWSQFHFNMIVILIHLLLVIISHSSTSSLSIGVDGFHLDAFNQRRSQSVSTLSLQYLQGTTRTITTTTTTTTATWAVQRKNQPMMDDFTIIDDDDINNDTVGTSTTLQVPAPTVQQSTSTTTMSWMERNSNFASGSTSSSSNNDDNNSYNQQRGADKRRSSKGYARDDIQDNNVMRRISSSVTSRGRDGSSSSSSSSSDNDSTTTTRSFRQDFRGTRVFVQNIASQTSWQTLKDHFRQVVDGGTVIFASISIDPITRTSKGHGIVQFETTDMAHNAIRNIRNHPLDGNILYVRPDVQESSNEQQQQQYQQQPTTRRYDNDNKYNNNNQNTKRYGPNGSTVPTSRPAEWKCANDNDEIVSLVDTDEYRAIEQMIMARDDARKRKNYVASDNIREQLKIDYNVHIDDRLRMWWIDIGSMRNTRPQMNSFTNDNKNTEQRSSSTVPKTIQEINGPGRWGALPEWRQIPTTPDNDACVDSTLVSALLQQRDIARREKDFRTADMLLEQARTSPTENDLQLRIHDESRTWRIWTIDKPSTQLLHGNNNRNSRKHYSNSNQSTDDDIYDKDTDTKSSNTNDGNVAQQQCIALVQQMAPDKVDEVQNLLDKFPGREWNILKKLKQRYNQK